MDMRQQLLESSPPEMRDKILLAFNRGAKMTDKQQTMWQIQQANDSIGTLNETDGYNCEKCNNRGFIAKYDEATGTTYSAECECVKIRNNLNRLKNSNLRYTEKYTFDNFKTITATEKTMKNTALKYIKDQSNAWLYIGGQSGAGKTHICTAICNTLISNGKEVLYIEWSDIKQNLTAFKYKADEYKKYFDKIANIEVLYVDDLLKRSKMSDEEVMEILYRLVNARYNSNLKTIISSEIYLRELFVADNAIAGRIKELAEKYVIEIPRDNKLNHRL